MSVLNQLASALGRRDEVPNQELAKRIVAKNDKAAVKELVENLKSKKKDIQADCIKTLYEAGYEKPALIAPYHKEFLGLLKSKNGRMIWGGMTALSTIVTENSKVIFDYLPEIMEAADGDSVIAKDHAAKILTILSADRKYSKTTLPLLIDFINAAPENQFPTYAENVFPVLDAMGKKALQQVLESRVGEMTSATKRKRVEKLLKKLGK
ncbi:MAG: hypothetical protein ACKOXB_05555 [Flavobacteriales bacterium]